MLEKDAPDMVVIISISHAYSLQFLLDNAWARNISDENQRPKMETKLSLIHSVNDKLVLFLAASFLLKPKPYNKYSLRIIPLSSILDKQ